MYLPEQKQIIPNFSYFSCAPTMHYSKLDIGLSPFLREMVHAVYIIQTHDSPVAYQALPSGYIGLTIITKGQSYPEEKEKINSCAFVVGQIHKPLRVFHSAHSTEVNIVFNPVKLRCWVGEPMRVFADGFMVAAEDVFPSKPLAKLIDQLSQESRHLVILNRIEEFLLKTILHEDIHKPSLHLYQAIQQLKTFEVSDLANTMGVSSTTLRNWSSEYIGMSPKELIQIKRFQKVLEARDISNLTEMAYQFQYYDQAHFIRDFKKLSGINPSRYFNNSNLAFDFYNYGRWIEHTFD